MNRNAKCMLNGLVLGILGVAICVEAEPRVGLLSFQQGIGAGAETEIVEELFCSSLSGKAGYRINERIKTAPKSDETQADYALQMGRQHELNDVFYGKLMKTGDLYFLIAGRAQTDSESIQTAQETFSSIESAGAAVARIVSALVGEASVKTQKTQGAESGGANSRELFRETDLTKQLCDDTQFLTWEKWLQSDVQEIFLFRAQTKSLPAKLLINNDTKNLYLLLVIEGDDFRRGIDPQTGRWADDRLFIVLDENGDQRFTAYSEDRVSIFLNELAVGSSPVLNRPCGDWYYQDDEKKWKSDRGGQNDKRVNFFYTGSCADGEVQDVAFEIKIPIHTQDKDDLQNGPGDKIGIGLTYGNLRDGYANFPSSAQPDYSPNNLFVYRLKDVKK